MSTEALPSPKIRRPRSLRWAVGAAAVVVLVGAMAFDTKVVRIGSASDVAPGTFSPASFGAAEFPKVQAAIEARAVDAKTLASAIAKDQPEAVKQYGVTAAAGAAPEMAVKFTGTVGQGDSGNYDVKVEGVPETLKIEVQTGPAIMGTDLRDAPGTISFGQFTNQIEYQNAGSALNKEMKKQVLSKIDAAHLAGKTVTVTGAFQLSDPNVWLVTPVRMSVQ